MGKHTLSRRLGGTMATATLLVAVAIPLTAIGKPDKVTICHAAGREGTDHFVTLELSAGALYGNGGHFEENGAPRAGHEGDYLGVCVGDVTETSEDTDTTLDTDDSAVTTVPDDTTSTPSEESTEVETVEETTTTTIGSESETVDVESAVETTLPTETPSSDSGDHGVGDTALDGDGSGNLPDVASAEEEVSDDDVQSATLPFTGVDQSLVIPSALLVLAGSVVVFLAGGFHQVSGSHVAGEAERLGLGLHRGRHEGS